MKCTHVHITPAMMYLNDAFNSIALNPESQISQIELRMS
jgi:hypothetical protein